MSLIRLFGLLALAVMLAATPGLGQARTNAVNFDDEQLAAVDRISAYLSGIDTLQGEFEQVGPGGEIARGRLMLQKPGKMRFEYFPPSELQVIADGLWLAVQDRKLNTTERYPLVSTPLNVILAEEVDLIRDSQVIAVFIAEEQVTVSLQDDSGEAPGLLTMMFDPASFELRQWVVTDAQGLDTSITLQNVVAGAEIPRQHFRILENKTLYVGDR